jgi:hypothetical protein
MRLVANQSPGLAVSPLFFASVFNFVLKEGFTQQFFI